MWRACTVVCAALLVGVLPLTGCTRYSHVERPMVTLGQIAPELAELTDADIERYLTARTNTEPPSVLAVAKLRPAYGRWRSDNPGALQVGIISAAEADGWRAFAAGDAAASRLEQVQMINPLLVSGPVDSRSLRAAAALLHAPHLLVYVQADEYNAGNNALAPLYWTIVGLYTAPGTTVGHYTVCQAVLIETRTGLVVGTAQGEALVERNVPHAYLDSVNLDARKQAEHDAVTRLQEDVRHLLSELAAAAPETSRP